MPLFKKKPVVIEAMQFTGDNWQDVVTWVRNNNGLIQYASLEPNILSIITLEGIMTVSLNDMVIKGVQGEFYPCKPDIFSSTYDSVE